MFGIGAKKAKKSAVKSNGAQLETKKTHQNINMASLFSKKKSKKAKGASEDAVDDYLQDLQSVIGDDTSDFNASDEELLNELTAEEEDEPVDDLDLDTLDVDDVLESEAKSKSEKAKTKRGAYKLTVKNKADAARKRQLAELDIDDVDLSVPETVNHDDVYVEPTDTDTNPLLDSLNLEDASVLVADMPDDFDEDVLNDLINTDIDNAEAEEDELVPEAEAEAEETDEFDVDLEPLADDELDLTDTPEEESEPEEDPEPEQQQAPAKITQDQAFDALSPVQQTILRNLEHIDMAKLKTVAQMSEANLYMQSQILEWNNAYARLMTRLNEWQEYANKLQTMLVAANEAHDEEMAKLQRRHQSQLKNMRSSIEAEYVEREQALAHDRELASNMLEKAQHLMAQVEAEKASSQKVIDGLHQQINVMTKRPYVEDIEGATPIAPSLSSLDSNPALQLHTTDDFSELLNDENWG